MKCNLVYLFTAEGAVKFSAVMLVVCTDVFFWAVSHVAVGGKKKKSKVIINFAFNMLDNIYLFIYLYFTFHRSFGGKPYLDIGIVNIGINTS